MGGREALAVENAPSVLGLLLGLVSAADRNPGEEDNDVSQGHRGMGGKGNGRQGNYTTLSRCRRYTASSRMPRSLSSLAVLVSPHWSPCWLVAPVILTASTPPSPHCTSSLGGGTHALLIQSYHARSGSSLHTPTSQHTRMQVQRWASDLSSAKVGAPTDSSPGGKPTGAAWPGLKRPASSSSLTASFYSERLARAYSFGVTTALCRRGGGTGEPETCRLMSSSLAPPSVRNSRQTSTSAMSHLPITPRTFRRVGMLSSAHISSIRCFHPSSSPSSSMFLTRRSSSPSPALNKARARLALFFCQRNYMSLHCHHVSKQRPPMGIAAT